MAIKLKKGMSFNLDKVEPGLTKVRVVLNWTPAQSGFKFDPDLTVAVLADDGVQDGQVKRTIFAEDEGYLVYYNNKDKRSPGGEVVHSGDDRTGADGEQADIDLALMHAEVSEVAIVGTIHKGQQRKQNWNMLKGRMRLENLATNEIIAEYELDHEFPTETAVQFGSLYRDENGQWQFQAIGVGYNVGLEAFIEKWT